METVQELIPLAKEMLAHKSKGKLVKLYVLGSVLAFFGVVLGLVETVCGPLTAASRPREEEAAVASLQAARDRQALQTQTRAGQDEGKQPAALQGSRGLSHRQHAS
ncbi:G0/G1 switch protein 2 [Echinops telfairi]|uniref:G0/G1 switch protein 2 n=1 Tax=Echinops telfairi TaxID=9371 RepID=A0ABM0IH37_ECHTE|nr:G0/G1 switch protein 2 [Echinops telfairi]